jgi:HTH-type transcriptional regulator / antitoxin HigA
LSNTLAIRPIRNEEDLKAAFARLEEIFDAPVGSPEGDESEVLAILIQAYEREHFPMEKSSPLEVIRFHMERLGWNQARLVPFMGAQSRVSEVLAGKRKLTVDMIRNLSVAFGIPADDLIG